MHAKKVSIWWLAMALIVMLVAPMIGPATPAAVDAAVALPDRPLANPRFHQDGWLADLSPEEQQAAENRLDAWFETWYEQVEQRPPVDPVRQTQAVADWTVMVYIAADNNLEPAGMFDVNEMEAVGSSPNVNILAQLDRSAEYVDYDGDWTEARRYFIQQDQDLERITSPVVRNLGEINSGSPEAVADFATWGITNYPADKYMLVLWDHGGGWISHSSDEDTGDDITLDELRGALDSVIADTGIDKFEVLGFDMCLMAQLEVIRTIAPYANYGIGSEENEPGAGWFYVWLNELVKNPKMNGAEVGQYVVDYFIYFFEEIWQYDAIYGLGVTDLRKSDQIIEALNRLTAILATNPQATLSAVGDARNNTITYAGFDDPQYYDIFSSVDLYAFADILSQVSNSADVQQAAQDVMQAVDAAVYHQRHSPELDGSHGISIYFPRTTKAFKFAGFRDRYLVEVTADMSPWYDYLNVFHGTAIDSVPTAPVVDVLNVYPDVASIYQPAVISMEVSGRDVLQVNYVVALIRDDDERIILDFDYLVSRTTTPSGTNIVDWSDGVTQRTFTWEAEVPVLTDGTSSTYALLIPNRDSADVAIVNGQYTSVRGGDPIDGQLVFNLQTRRSTAVWGFSETSGGALTPFEIQVEPGDQFRPLWLTMDADNDLSGSSLANETLTLSAVDAITFEMVPAPTGQYSVSFVAENVAGEKTLDEVIIQVSNENLDVAYRGYTDLVYGVNFLYPAGWIRPRFTPDGQRLFTADLATNTVLSLFPYSDVSSAQETDEAIRASWNQLENLQIVQQTEVEIQGEPAFVTDYTYTYQGEARVGAVIAIYVPSQATGYAFDLDAPASNTGPAQEAIQTLVGSINFFEPDSVAGESAWQTRTLAGGLVSFPVPAAWVEEASGSWTLFGPANDESIFVGLAVDAASGQTNQQLAQEWLDQLQASLTGLEVLASEPYYVGNEEWYVVVFTYESDVKMAGAFFVTGVGQQEFTFWIEAPDTVFDEMYADVFSVIVDGFTFNG